VTAPVLYGHPFSVYTRSARLALEEKGVPYTLEVLGPAVMKSPEHLAAHPFGKIPYLQHDGAWIYETLAILDYVDGVWGGPPLRPADPKAAARMSQIVQVVHNYVVPAWGGGIIRHRLIGPLLRGTLPDEAAIAAALPQAIHCAGVLDGLVGETAYLAADHPSLADLMLAPLCYSVSQTPEAASVLAPFPRLSGWWARMAQRSSVEATRPDFTKRP